MGIAAQAQYRIFCGASSRASGTRRCKIAERKGHWHHDDRHGGDQSMALTRRRPRDWSRRSISL
jgi:hypothetical protein